MVNMTMPQCLVCNASFASDITKIEEKAIQFHGTFHGLKIKNWNDERFVTDWRMLIICNKNKETLANCDIYIFLDKSWWVLVGITITSSHISGQGLFSACPSSLHVPTLIWVEKKNWWKNGAKGKAYCGVWTSY